MTTKIKKARTYFENNIANNPDYIRHITETAHLLNMDRKVVSDVMGHFFTMSILLAYTKRKRNILRIIWTGCIRIDRMIDFKIYKKLKDESKRESSRNGSSKKHRKTTK